MLKFKVLHPQNECLITKRHEGCDHPDRQFVNKVMCNRA